MADLALGDPAISPVVRSYPALGCCFGGATIQQTVVEVIGGAR
jgi:hypothetical protein